MSYPGTPILQATLPNLQDLRALNRLQSIPAADEPLCPALRLLHVPSRTPKKRRKALTQRPAMIPYGLQQLPQQMPS
jgi:hypothetical protein